MADSRIIIDARINTSQPTQAAKSLKSQAASIAAEYRKQGMSMSDAMKKAWSEIEREGAEGARNTTKSISGIKTAFSGLSSTVSRLGGLLTSILGPIALTVTAALGAAAVAVTKQATDAYADYEQLTGGMETLFKNSASKIAGYAEDAFYTAGVSANKYMEIVTSFSASLISSLSGDTEKAANVANMALIDMSDNANKMGTAMESIQNAYQGFAKQNYTMLDNLKLGYGGTKTEMERLLRDAEAFSGVKYNINNLSDVYNAIHAIQEKLGVAGATAAEAEGTITGSANMTKAAWENVLTAISGGGDLDKAINNLVYSVSKYFENIVPVVERSLSGIGQLIEKIAPQLVQTVATALIKALPSLLNAVYQMIIGLAQGIYQGIIALFKGGSVTTEISAQLNGVTDSANDAADATYGIADATEAAGKAAKKSLAGFDELNTLADQSGSSGSSGVSSGVTSGNVSVGTVTVGGEVNDQFSPALRGIIEKISAFAEELKTAFEPSIAAFKNFGLQIGSSITESLPSFTAGLDGFKSGFGSIGTYLSEELIPNIVNGWNTNILPIFGDVTGFAIAQTGLNFQTLGATFQDAVDNIIKPALGNFETISTDVLDTVGEAWKTHGDDLLTNLGTAFDGLRETWDTFYKEFIEPIATTINEWVAKIWEESLKPLWDDLVDAFMSISNDLLILWNTVLKPVVDWVLQRVYPVVKQVVDNVLAVLETLYSMVSGIIQGVIKVIKGIVQFITGVFTGDWEKAWEGIKNIFGGIWDAIWSVIKGVINLIIDGINTLWSGIYSAVRGIVNTIGDVSGVIGDLLGQDWSFSMPAKPPLIPKLAQGAVLPPNKPFMAIVGDQKHGTNIEAPLSTIQEAVALVMEDQVSAMMAGFEAVVQAIQEKDSSFQIGDDVIYTATERYRSKMAIVKGG